VDGVVAAGASDADEATKGIAMLSVAPVADPIAVGDNDPRVEPFGASGASHSEGLVPDPGVTEGSARYLREDSVWVQPDIAAIDGLQDALDDKADVVPLVATLTDAATIATNAAAAEKFDVSSAVDRTLGVPTNAADGMARSWWWTNTDAVAHTLTLTEGSAGAFLFGQNVPEIPATPAGATTSIVARYSSAMARWLVVGHDVFGA
jgi:hypothetical protein